MLRGGLWCLPLYLKNWIIRVHNWLWHQKPEVWISGCKVEEISTTLRSQFNMAARLYQHCMKMVLYAVYWPLCLFLVWFQKSYQRYCALWTCTYVYTCTTCYCRSAVCCYRPVFANNATDNERPSCFSDLQMKCCQLECDAIDSFKFWLQRFQLGLIPIFSSLYYMFSPLWLLGHAQILADSISPDYCSIILVVPAKFYSLIFGSFRFPSKMVATLSVGTVYSL